MAAMVGVGVQAVGKVEARRSIGAGRRSTSHCLSSSIQSSRDLHTCLHQGRIQSGSVLPSRPWTQFTWLNALAHEVNAVSAARAIEAAEAGALAGCAVASLVARGAEVELILEHLA